MPTVPLQLGMQSNPSRHTSAGSARIYNCYLEPGGEEASAPAALWPVAGLASWATLSGGGGIRAWLATSNYLYVVAGRVLFRVDSSGTATAIGGIPTDGSVFMARNRAEPEPQIGIVSDGLYWVVTGATLVENVDTDLPPASSIDVLNGYFILPGYAGVFYISDTDNATDIDPGDFGSAESLPDNCLRVAVRESEMIIFSTESIEFWQDVGAEFPFSRVQAIGIGCLAARSVAKLDRTLIWVAPDFSVREMQGYGGRIISTFAVSRDIEDEPDKAGITGTAWAEAGHWFYAISGTNWTWVYDAVTGKWHQRRSYGANRWKCNYVVSFAGMTLAGDRSTGTIYRMSRSVYAEGNEPLETEVIAPAAKAFPYEIVVTRLDFRMVTGTGLVPGDSASANPVVMVSVSKDGGATFGTERHVSLGVRGDRDKKLFATRWGKAFNPVFKFRVTAPIEHGYLEASIDYTAAR